MFIFLWSFLYGLYMSNLINGAVSIGKVLFMVGFQESTTVPILFILFEMFLFVLIMIFAYIPLLAYQIGAKALKITNGNR